MKSKHVLFKSRYITREYTPLGIHSLESAAHSKQFKPRSLTNWILPWKNKSEPDYTNASQEHCGNPSLKTKKVHAHPANKKRKELSHCLPSKFYARFTHGSHEHTSQLSVVTKRVYAYPPLKKRVIYATGHPLQDLRKRYKGELTTLWSLLTENKKLHPNPQHNDLHNLVKMCEEQITISCPTLTLTETQEWEEHDIIQEQISPARHQLGFFFYPKWLWKTQQGTANTQPRHNQDTIKTESRHNHHTTKTQPIHY